MSANFAAPGGGLLFGPGQDGLVAEQALTLWWMAWKIFIWNSSTLRALPACSRASAWLRRRCPRRRDAPKSPPWPAALIQASSCGSKAAQWSSCTRRTRPPRPCRRGVHRRGLAEHDVVLAGTAKLPCAPDGAGQQQQRDRGGGGGDRRKSRRFILKPLSQILLTERPGAAEVPASPLNAGTSATEHRRRVEGVLAALDADQRRIGNRHRPGDPSGGRHDALGQTSRRARKTVRPACSRSVTLASAHQRQLGALRLQRRRCARRRPARNRRRVGPGGRQGRRHRRRQQGCLRRRRGQRNHAQRIGEVDGAVDSSTPRPAPAPAR